MLLPPGRSPSATHRTLQSSAGPSAVRRAQLAGSLGITRSSGGVWSFSRNKSAAKDLIEYLCQREQVEARCNAVAGYDIPPYESMADFSIWERVEPPSGTLFKYPIRPHHHAEPSIAGAPAPPELAVQIYNA